MTGTQFILSLLLIFSLTFFIIWHAKKYKENSFLLKYNPYYAKNEMGSKTRTILLAIGTIVIIIATFVRIREFNQKWHPKNGRETNPVGVLEK